MKRRAKPKPIPVSPCPFCGKTPDGNSFVSTGYGPALICNHCSANGPASEWPKEQAGLEFERHRRGAIRQWNQRARDAASWKRGVEAAAEFVTQFDKYVDHGYRLSDCILSKFNLLNRRVRWNTRASSKALAAAIHYWQVCFRGNASVGHPDRVRSSDKFDREMKKLHKAR